MYEHVARDALGDYFGHAWRLLRPRGVFLAHGMSSAPAPPTRAGPSFLETYVFPDHDLVPVSTVLAAAEGAQFEVRDVESLREHYADVSALAGEPRSSPRRCSGSRTRPSTASGGFCLERWPTGSRAGTRTSTRRCSLLDLGVTGSPLSRADWYP